MSCGIRGRNTRQHDLAVRLQPNGDAIVAIVAAGPAKVERDSLRPVRSERRIRAAEVREQARHGEIQVAADPGRAAGDENLAIRLFDQARLQFRPGLRAERELHEPLAAADRRVERAAVREQYGHHRLVAVEVVAEQRDPAVVQDDHVVHPGTDRPSVDRVELQIADAARTEVSVVGAVGPQLRDAERLRIEAESVVLELAGAAHQQLAVGAHDESCDLVVLALDGNIHEQTAAIAE